MLNLSHRGLYLLASSLWLFASLKVLIIASGAWGRAEWLGAGIWFVVAFVFFTGFIFRRVVPANVQVIRQREERRLPFYACFAPKTWLTMLFMISLGLGLRYSEVVSDNFIAGFYTGLGLSLLLSVRFYIRPIRLGYRYRNDGQ